MKIQRKVKKKTDSSQEKETFKKYLLRSQTKFPSLEISMKRRPIFSNIWRYCCVTVMDYMTWQLEDSVILLLFYFPVPSGISPRAWARLSTWRLTKASSGSPEGQHNTVIQSVDSFPCTTFIILKGFFKRLSHLLCHYFPLILLKFYWVFHSHLLKYQPISFPLMIRLNQHKFFTRVKITWGWRIGF